MIVKQMTRQERKALQDMKRTEALQNKRVKAFNKLLQDKNIRSIKKERGGFYCITYANGAQFRCRGHVVDNSSIYEKSRHD